MNKIFFLKTKIGIFSLAFCLTLSLFSVAATANNSTITNYQRNNERRLERIADRIERAFESDPMLRRYNLDADEENGRYIEIEGTVRTRAERNRALEIARQNAPGNVRIVNKIRVRR